MRRTTTRAAAALATASLAAAAPAAAAAHRLTIHGGWQSLVNCVFTSYDPLSGHMTCVGSTLWTGDLRGVTRYTLTGSYDPVTGDSRGTLHETFRGRDRAGDRGTIALDERYTLDGAASRIAIDARAVSGTGDFAGVRGALAFRGTDNVATGFGTFSGSLDLRHGARRPSA